MSDNKNFKCECGKEYYIQKYTCAIRGDNKVYLDKYTNKQLLCTCGQVLQDIKKFNGFPTAIGAFNMKTEVEKKAILKKRSQNHFKKEIEEQKIQKHKDFIKEAKNL